jgi:hypothetical protein
LQPNDRAPRSVEAPGEENNRCVLVADNQPLEVESSEDRRAVTEVSEGRSL